METANTSLIPYELDPNYDNLAGVNRLERAFAILGNAHDIKRISASEYMVKSQRGLLSYLVTNHDGEWKCTCPDCIIHGAGWECKHITAVKEYLARKEKHIKEETKTQRDWNAYTMGQLSEGELFPIYLKEITSMVNEPVKAPSRGRKAVPLSDNLCMSITKVASQFSSRRAYSDVVNSVDKEYNYNGVNIFLNREDITPILRELVQLSASPLANIEENFAVDASGFGTYQFGDWKGEKWGGKKQHTFIKAHVACGVFSNVITDAIITDSTVGDMNVLPSLLNGTTGRFTPKEVYADAGYLSNNNYREIAKTGATPYIYFKDSVTGKGCPAWRNAFVKFISKHDEFMAHYRLRNNVETVFGSIKAKFQEKLKSKNLTAQINELYCKIIAYNISVVIRMAHTDNVEVMFK